MSFFEDENMFAL